MKTTKLLLVMLISIAVAACGGGGANEPSTSSNTPPVASAGPIQNVTTGTLVTLNGSASSDANSDPLTYKWTLTSKPVGSTATLTGSTSAASTFMADLAGTYLASLVVNDGQVNSTVATVTVTAAAAAGTLDIAFNSSGKVTTAFASGSAEANDAVIQSDGKIVVAGTITSNGVSSIIVARYNTDGSLDASFGAAGSISTPIGFGNAYGKAVALQSDGKILVAGGTLTSSSPAMYGFALLRYNADGSLDTTLGTTGKVTTAINTARSDANAIAVQYDGKIVLAGISNNVAYSSSDATIARYNADGSFDNTFGTAGRVTITNSMKEARAVSLQGDGKIIVAGTSSIYNRLNRFNPDGTVDTSFGGIGNFSVFYFLSTLSTFNSVLVQPDGKIVAVGEAYNEFAFARLNPSNGSEDATFNPYINGYIYGGKKLVGIGTSTSNDVANDVALQADGKIVAVGTTFEGLNSDFALARLTSDGNTADINTVTTVGTTHTSSAKAVVIQSDGKIIAVGSTGGTNSSFALVRYLP